MNEVCESCRTPFDAGAALKMGRPRKYCSDACRQSAYRARHEAAPLPPVVATAVLPPPRKPDSRSNQPVHEAPQRPPAPPSDADEILAEILRDIQAGAREMVKTLPTADGEGPLRQVARMQEQLDSLTAGMVGRARVHRTTWATIGKTLRISEDTARHRYPDRVIERSLSRFSRIRSKAGQGFAPKLRGMSLTPAGSVQEPTPETKEPGPEETDAPTTTREPSGAAYNRLAPVLSMLVRSAQLTNKDVSASIGCSASYLSRILSGERVPTWPLTQRFARACGADPDVLRTVWETERLSDKARDPEPAQEKDHLQPATVRLRAALNTLHTKAGRPAPYDIVVASHWTLEVPQIAALLEGERIPGWDVIQAFVQLLAGDTGYFKHLWLQAGAELSQEYHLSEAEPSVGKRTEGASSSDTADAAETGPARLDSVITAFGDVFRQESMLESGRARLLDRLAERRHGLSVTNHPGPGPMTVPKGLRMSLRVAVPGL
ncbi:helix-turn-helix domain-containing protein [Streptomyces sp. H27-S2]|uniref:helix-turn-helix domain-containing protein n=1 Tax=Streptomyces antarcticus TaxID=2996458 RepID=UPI002271B6B0|nr:helix-turn-helix transcriptional regulator [Streptomyces sp. H27-S2]MCY0954117.1 helix-turn-helix transcriptional regulator [Streptomyces sp. H27-S2]